MAHAERANVRLSWSPLDQLAAKQRPTDGLLVQRRPTDPPASVRRPAVEGWFAGAFQTVAWIPLDAEPVMRYLDPAVVRDQPFEYRLAWRTESGEAIVSEAVEIAVSREGSVSIAPRFASFDGLRRVVTPMGVRFRVLIGGEEFGLDGVLWDQHGRAFRIVGFDGGSRRFHVTLADEHGFTTAIPLPPPIDSAGS